ncbi:FAD/NAD(P)-binding domain-containing protein [Decorospora gaudefroyi]|uniref:FAD/NAD(P)-binding domain-containing protein n=1 Tax=Decorospora gaudefroyi TaxID=184978 RepID=A0A6A5K484_9PLEO|nr:FAD/NAD(P)-binding domain-containing protein [Decorospora gaudefroyi]
MHVLIVGAGLGGLTLAQNLRKRGVSYEVFERDANKDSRFQGWAIALHTITDDLIASMPDDLPDLKQATNHMLPLKLPTQICLYPAESNMRVGWEDSGDTPFIRAERYRLRNWLSTNIPIKWGKRVQHIQHSDQGVSVTFEDGTSAQGDILVGADGVKSAVRQQLLQKSHDELLKVIPLAAIVGQLTISGEAFKRQLELSHGSYSLIDAQRGYLTFCSLHDVAPDGKSARYYWIMSRNDATIADPDHWLKKATQQEKLDYVREIIKSRDPKFREIFDLTPVEGIREETHVWCDLELSSLPAGRVILMGDAAHVMTPFRGEGGYNTFLDAMSLAKSLDRLEKRGAGSDIKAIKAEVEDYNAEMLVRGVKSVKLSREWVDGSKVKDKQPLLAPMKVIPHSEVLLEVSA